MTEKTQLPDIVCYGFRYRKFCVNMMSLISSVYTCEVDLQKVVYDAFLCTQSEIAMSSKQDKTAW